MGGTDGHRALKVNWMRGRPQFHHRCGVGDFLYHSNMAEVISLFVGDLNYRRSFPGRGEQPAGEERRFEF